MFVIAKKFRPAVISKSAGNCFQCLQDSPWRKFKVIFFLRINAPVFRIWVGIPKRRAHTARSQLHAFIKNTIVDIFTEKSGVNLVFIHMRFKACRVLVEAPESESAIWRTDQFGRIVSEGAIDPSQTCASVVTHTQERIRQQR